MLAEQAQRVWRILGLPSVLSVTNKIGCRTCISIESELGRHLFIADGSRLFDADEKLFLQLDAAITEGHIGGLLDRLGLTGTPFIDDAPLSSPPIHALSLAIAQKCILGCSYCYAKRGKFGGPAKMCRRKQPIRPSIC